MSFEIKSEKNFEIRNETTNSEKLLNTSTDV